MKTVVLTYVPCQTLNPDIWFPNPADVEVRQAAINLCHACPMLAACRKATDDLEDRIGPQLGIWAGQTRYQRRQRTGRVKFANACVDCGARISRARAAESYCKGCAERHHVYTPKQSTHRLKGQSR
ncbi:WhiB family transcriptional regulator [Propionimicrobium sp. PCR01-08-3]|uniref:WhiB family transcriptional regulator n=1 Tax=Propionimicrobium sp. PCR01-08-3 TaxID=3052086 RepID=UPI00255CB2AF|nr:WhiB family transcriptional regulator [Propionimicrobium sp. PCR01-08-3]WIY84311.1 WhiB family transcriptional regulator [Propionimicrobium sp. PCR01-08-3]